MLHKSRSPQSLKRKISPSSQLRAMQNQVSPDSPFKRYKLKGEGETSSEEEDDYDDYQVRPKHKSSQKSRGYDPSSSLRFPKGHFPVSDPTDPQQFYDKLKYEEWLGKVRVQEDSPWKYHTPFQAVIEARTRGEPSDMPAG